MTTVVMSNNTIVADRKISTITRMPVEIKEKEKQRILNTANIIPHYKDVAEYTLAALESPPSETTKIFDVSNLNLTINGDKVLAIGGAGNGVLIQLLERLEKGIDLVQHLTYLTKAIIDAVRLYEDEVVADMLDMMGSPAEARMLGVSDEEYAKGVLYGCSGTQFAIVGEKNNYVLAQKDAVDPTLFVNTYEKDITVGIGSGSVMLNIQHNGIVYDELTMSRDIIGTGVYAVKDEVDEYELISFIREASLYDPMTGTETDVLKF